MKNNVKLLKILLLIVLIGVFFSITILSFFVLPGNNGNSEKQEYNHLITRLQQLKSLPYTSTAPVDNLSKTKEGVVYYDREAAYPGFNVYIYDEHPGASILGMSGNIVHKFVDRRSKPTLWQLLERTENENFFIVLSPQRSLFKIDRESNIYWETIMPFHHDLDMFDQKIFSVANKKKTFGVFSKTEKIVDNLLVILNDNGEILKTISFARLLAKNPELKSLVNSEKVKEYRYGKDAWDVMHTNSIVVIKNNRHDVLENIFEIGNILFCMRHLDIVGIVDLWTEEIVWYWGNHHLDNPHDPVYLENGNILIFDNGSRRGYSRVIELNPLTEEIEWSYGEAKNERFFSDTRGSVQRLPNGNTIIVSSNNGHVFEITPQREIVWEFYTYFSNQEKTERHSVYRMPRWKNLQ